MSKRVIAVCSILLMAVFASSAFPSDNGVTEGTKKVEGGFKAVGTSVGEIGAKAAKATEGAAKDSGSALGRAWDDIVKGVKKAFK